MAKRLDDYTKDDWLDANLHGPIARDTVIHRVFRADYLLKDLEEGTNTLVHPCFETQGDDLENPLKNASFSVDGHKHQLFSSLMAEYYAQSWSLSKPAWGKFGQGKDTVRVTSTVGDIFSRLMDNGDQFYSLYYHAGLIDYSDAGSIRAGLSRGNFEDFLDSRGYALLKTVLKIRFDFQKEEEVRFVYIRSPRHGYDYPLRQQVSGQQSELCAHTFDWHNSIEGFEFCPNNRASHPGLHEKLEQVKVAKP
ncbi:hypothetical protein ACNJRW_15485 [Stenotrophomonas maltophilia]